MPSKSPEIISLWVTNARLNRARDEAAQRQIAVLPLQPWASHKDGWIVKLSFSDDFFLFQGENDAIRGPDNGEAFDEPYAILSKRPGQVLRLEAKKLETRLGSNGSVVARPIPSTPDSV